MILKSVKNVKQFDGIDIDYILNRQMSLQSLLCITMHLSTTFNTSSGGELYRLVYGSRVA